MSLERSDELSREGRSLGTPHLEHDDSSNSLGQGSGPLASQPLRCRRPRGRQLRG